MKELYLSKSATYKGVVYEWHLTKGNWGFIYQIKWQVDDGSTATGFEIWQIPDFALE